MFRSYKFTVTGFAGFDLLDVKCPGQLTFQKVMLKLNYCCKLTDPGHFYDKLAVIPKRDNTNRYTCIAISL